MVRRSRVARLSEAPPVELPDTRKHYAIPARALGPWRPVIQESGNDLRQSPLVTLEEQLIGKGMQLAVYDPAVRLSLLPSANRRYIDSHLPHIGELLRAEIGDVVNRAKRRKTLRLFFEVPCRTAKLLFPIRIFWLEYFVHSAGVRLSRFCRKRAEEFVHD